ncbi:hypothetical protein [Streptomyces sp. KMM 9044]|uniref:hypothetical protein n=1 Tax=Streptomyces sp. KMM 9044 TaxID=2744474 RepID=UPI003FA72DB1
MVRALFTRGFSALVVASGAIAIGREDLAGAGNEDATRRQVLAAVGQGPHFQGIREAFARQGMSCAQFLLTPQDICDPPHSEPVRAALEHTLELGIVPVVNENDALSVRNNDVLAALSTPGSSRRTMGFLGRERVHDVTTARAARRGKRGRRGSRCRYASAAVAAQRARSHGHGQRPPPDRVARRLRRAAVHLGHGGLPRRGPE